MSSTTDSSNSEVSAIKSSLAALEERRSVALQGGGERRLTAQRQRGKLTARARLSRLFDGGRFTEIDSFATHRSTDLGLDRQRFEGDSVVTAWGSVEGRTVFSYAQDFTVLGGSLSQIAAQKIAKVMDHATKVGAPLVGINDSGGARIQEGIDSLAGYGEVFRRNTLASGVIPQITVIAGPCAGGAVYSPAMTDFIFMVEGIGQMYITGPDVVKSVTGEDVSHEQLGGAATHATTSGVAHWAFQDEDSCYAGVRQLLGYLPPNNASQPPRVMSEDPTDRASERMLDIMPDDPNRPYDILEVLDELLDDGEYLQVHSGFAPNIVVGFGRIAGGVVGFVANQPNALAGVLDINASDKGARFVRFCDAFNIPIVTLVDVPGFMPGSAQEQGGIIRHGAKMLYAYSEATVPKVTVILRKAYGGAYNVMGSKELRCDVNLAWPSAEIAVMGPEGAVNVVRRREIAAAEDPATTRAELVADYRETFANPYVAANRGYIDDVIDPRQTRSKVADALRMLENKVDDLPAKKHGNIPL